MSVLALCPSRGRPAQAHELLVSFRETVRDPRSRLVIVVDEDDAERTSYPSGITVAYPPGGCMGAALKHAADDRALLGDATVVGMVGDDNRFRTPGWDVTFRDALETDWGIAYGDDGFQHERLPTAWWMSRVIVDRFGMALPALRHFYMDNWAMAMGQGAGCLRYFPEVNIEHLHPLAGKAEDDAIYRRSYRNAARDRLIFRRWERTAKAGDVARLRGLLDTRRPRRVFADWHHPALWESLRLLFEVRFGWELYSPIGTDWTAHGWTFEQGTPGWDAARYLTFPDAVLAGEHWERVEPDYGQVRKMVTWEQAAGMRWDHVLSSVAVHQRPFWDLARKWGARAIHQVGNARHLIDPRVPQVILASANVPRGARKAIRYHQEFDLNLFAYSPPTEHLRVTSLMLRLETTSGPYQWLADALGERWSAPGGAEPGAPEYLSPASRVAAAIRDSAWIWHDKKIGDGYGHVIHNAMAMGRPLIGHASHYAGLRAEPYWKDLDTALDLDRHQPTDALRLLRAIAADPDWHRDIAERCVAAFRQHVDFDAEAEAIRAALT